MITLTHYLMVAVIKNKKGIEEQLMKSRKVSLAALVAAILAPLALAPNVMAWGPERPTYTMNQPADHATFNSITDNAGVGDERDFVRIVEKNTGNTYTSDLELEAGKQYEVYIYYHNDASATYNDSAHNNVGVARDVRLSSYFPHELAKGEEGQVSGKISSINTDPLVVWDEAFVTAKEAMTLHYVEGSAKIYNKYNMSGTVLSTNLFSEQGTFLGLAKLNGVILGCDEYSGHVVYTLQTVATGEPAPTPDPKPVEPELPTELPKTGPVEIVFAIVIVCLIIAGIVYWNRTHKAVKKATKKAKGKKR